MVTVLERLLLQRAYSDDEQRWVLHELDFYIDAMRRTVAMRRTIESKDDSAAPRVVESTDDSAT